MFTMIILLGPFIQELSLHQRPGTPTNVKCIFSTTLYIKTKGGHTPEGEVEKIYWVCYLTCKKKETSCKEIRVSITKLKL
jgi:hypothetical protein